MSSPCLVRGTGRKAAFKGGWEVVVFPVGVLMEQQIVYDRNVVVLVAVYRLAAYAVYLVVSCLVQNIAAQHLCHVHLIVEGQRRIQLTVRDVAAVDVISAAVYHGKVYFAVRLQSVFRYGVAGKTRRFVLVKTAVFKVRQHLIRFLCQRFIRIVYHLLYGVQVGPRVIVGHEFVRVAGDFAVFPQSETMWATL